MNQTQSCRHTYPQHSVSNLYTRDKDFGITSNSDNNTYEIEISENISDESCASKSDKKFRYRKDDNPFFESYYPSFFPDSGTDTSVGKTSKNHLSEDRIFEVPSVATFYCETHGKPACCPKKCNHLPPQSESRSCQHQPPPKKVCAPQCSAHRTQRVNPCERKKSECETPKIKKRSTIDFKLPPCNCGKCEDDHCDGSSSSRRRSSGTYVVSSESDYGVREKRKCYSREDEKREEECPEKKVKRDSCGSSNGESQVYFQHYRDKLCGFEEKRPERQRSYSTHESCQCSMTSDRLKEISKRIEALESMYRKEQDAYDDHDHDHESRSSRGRDRREARDTRDPPRKRHDEDRQSKKVKETSSRTSRYEKEEDENLDTPDPDLAKTAEEIENELLEIRRRLQKLEAIHHERERSKARRV